MEIIGILLLLLQILVATGAFKKIPLDKIIDSTMGQSEQPYKKKYKPCPACKPQDGELINGNNGKASKRLGCYNCGGKGKVLVLQK